MNDTRTENEVVARMRRCAAEYRFKKRFIATAMILVSVVLLATLVFERWGVTPSWWSNVTEFLPWFLVFVGGAAMMAQQRLHDSVKRVVSFTDKRLLAPIIELLDSENEGERVLACHACRRLLPLFTEEDFADLTSDQRIRLMKSIGSSKDAVFVATVLSAAKKYGQQDCLAPLDDFIKGRIAVHKDERAYSGSLAHMALADIRLRVARSQIESASPPPRQVSVSNAGTDA